MISETIDQKFADAKRIIDLALQEHDGGVLMIGLDKLSNAAGNMQAAEDALLIYVSDKIGSDEFSFVHEGTGDVSPLL